MAELLHCVWVDQDKRIERVMAFTHAGRLALSHVVEFRQILLILSIILLVQLLNVDLL